LASAIFFIAARVVVASRLSSGCAITRRFVLPSLPVNPKYSSLTVVVVSSPLTMIYQT